MTESSIYEIRLKDRFTSPLSSLESKMDRFESKVGGLKSVFTGLSGSIAGAFTGGIVFGGIESLISKVHELGNEIINTSRQFDNLKRSIEFASGQDAKKNIQFLDAEIDRLGLDIQATYKGFKTFSGALMGTALEGEKGREIFTAVAEAATVMGLSADQMEGTFLALGQMISKGNVQAEELRGQLGERLPGAFNIFARALGVSTQKLNKMLQDGEVIAEKTLPLFAAELRKTFSPGVLSAQHSFNANMARFDNFIFRAKLRLGNGLLPLVNDFITIVPELDFSIAADSFNRLADSFRNSVSIFDDILQMAGLATDKFTALQFAVDYVSNIFSNALLPVRLLLSGIKLVVTAVHEATKVFGEFIEMNKNFFSGDWASAGNNLRRLENFSKDMKSTLVATWDSIVAKERGFVWPWETPDRKDGNSSFASGSDSGAGSRGGSTTATGKTSTAGVEKIASGTRNITVNITKLIETVKFEKWNGQSESQLMEMIKKALVTSVNDVNIVAQ